MTTDGKVKASLQRPVHFAGTWKANGRGTLVINDVIDLPDDQLTLRVGVTSAQLRKMGSAHITLDVPNFRSTRVQVSPLVIGGPARRVAATNSLQFVTDLVPFQPTTDRVFAASDTLRAFARAYWKSSDTAADAVIAITGPTSVAPRTVPLAVQVGAGQRLAVFDTPVPLQGLAPGNYVLSIDVRVGKEKPVRRDVPFTIR
jgi:hypothetical protein